MGDNIKTIKMLLLAKIRGKVWKKKLLRKAL